jgi:hypothetical protein
VFAEDEFHRDDRNSLYVLGAVDIDNVRVIDAGSQLPLALEPRSIRRCQRAVTQNLDSEAPACFGVIRLIHFAHTALPEKPHNPVRAKGLAIAQGRRFEGCEERIQSRPSFFGN